MNLPSDPRDKRASIRAGVITFGVALIVLVLLYVMTVGSDRAILAETSTPEFQDDEEIFLEPEMLVMEDPGEEVEEVIKDLPAPPAPGEPDPAETPEQEQPVRVVKNDIESPEPPVTTKPQLVSTPKESDVKTSTPPLSDQEKRAASMKGKFVTDNNGSRNGVDGPVASVGETMGFAKPQGSVSGRSMLSCPTKKLTITQPTTIKVRIEVNADGRVTSATAISGGTPLLRKECEQMARQSKWTKEAGAPLANGTITFHISL